MPQFHSQQDDNAQPTCHEERPVQAERADGVERQGWQAYSFTDQYVQPDADEAQTAESVSHATVTPPSTMFAQASAAAAMAVAVAAADTSHTADSAAAIAATATMASSAGRAAPTGLTEAAAPTTAEEARAPCAAAMQGAAAAHDEGSDNECHDVDPVDTMCDPTIEAQEEEDAAGAPSAPDSPARTSHHTALVACAAADEETLYDILELPTDATPGDIRRAYKRLCIKHHPDKGGERDIFDLVARAYQILSDPRLRQVYDTQGINVVNAVQERDQGSESAEDRCEQSQPIFMQRSVPLEMAYTGWNISSRLKRVVGCPHCGGSGYASETFFTQCYNCKGRGQVCQVVQMGSRFYEQWGSCNTCLGKGRVLPQSALCSGCGGAQLVEEQVVVNFEVPPGIAHGEHITAHGQGDRLPGRNPGNAVLVCNIEEHASFLRRGNDLMTEQCVPLHLALCGGVFEVPHLGSRTLRVRVPRGMVLRPGMIKSVPCEGMPKRHNVHLHGDLLLRFAVDFPDTIPEDMAVKLEVLLTGNPENALAQQDPADDSNEVYLADSDLQQFGRSSYAVWNSAYNADPEERS